MQDAKRPGVAGHDCSVDYIGFGRVTPLPPYAAAGAEAPPRWRWLACLAAVILAGAGYLNALGNPFVYDDHRVVVDNRSIVAPLNVRALLLHDASRPVVNLTYALDRATWGAAPTGFHVTNVLLHMANVGLLWLLASRSAARRRFGVATIAAALLAAHPMMTQAVGYISGRPEVLCALGFLLALLAITRAESLMDRWGLLALACWFAALGSKETAVMFPLVALAHDRWATTRGVAERRQRLRSLYAPLLAFAALAVVARLAVFGLLERNGSLAPAWSLALVDLDVLRRYVMLLVVPGDQLIFHAISPVKGLLSARAIAGLAVTATLLAGAWVARKRDGLATVGVAWFLLLLVPSFALVLLDRAEPMAEHRVYLASCGLFLALAVAIERMDDALGGTRVARTTFRVAGVVLVALLFARTVVRNTVWSDPIVLWTEASMAAPDHWLPYVPLGEALHAAGRHNEAAPAFAMALQLRPDTHEALRKLGICLLETGDLNGASAAFERLAALEPGSWEAAAGDALVALARGDKGRARDRLAEARRRGPGDETTAQSLDTLGQSIEADQQ